MLRENTHTDTYDVELYLQQASFESQRMTMLMEDPGGPASVNKFPQIYLETENIICIRCLWWPTQAVAARGQGAPGQMTWLKGFRPGCRPGFRPGCLFFKRNKCV